jgi:carbon storage regulator
MTEMLVLTRKTDGTICIGDDIVIKVIQTGRGSVKLGIEAPNHVRILRGELKDPEALIEQSSEHVALLAAAS